MMSCEDVIGRAGSEPFGLQSTLVLIEAGAALSESLSEALRSIDFEPMFQRYSSVEDWLVGEPDAATSLVVLIHTDAQSMAAMSVSLAELRRYTAQPQFVILSDSDEPGCALEAMLMGAVGFISTELPSLVVAQALKLICGAGLSVSPSRLRVLALAAERPDFPAMLGGRPLNGHQPSIGDPHDGTAEATPCRTDVQDHVRRLLGKVQAARH